MSTPSPKAKQAAERIIAWLEPGDDPFTPGEHEKVEEFVQQAIDAAMAELRGAISDAGAKCEEFGSIPETNDRH